MSFIVRRSGKTGWKIGKIKWTNGKKSQDTIKRDKWASFGFSESMSLEEAKARASQLNKEQSLDRIKQVRAAKAVEKYELIQHVCLPEEDAKAFQTWISASYPPHKVKHNKIFSHWHKAQQVVKTLELLPHKFYSNKERIYNEFISQKLAPDYAMRVIRMLDMWGEFLSERRGQFYRKIPRPSRNIRNEMLETYIDSKRYRGPSELLTPQMLAKLKDILPIEQYRFLYMTLWFGLRPEEVRSLFHKQFAAYIEVDSAINVEVLWIYQSKLKAVPREQRWKGIPAFLPEQQTGLKIVREKQELKEPLIKTIKKHLGKRVTLYGGRKAFEDLMLSHGQSFEDLSAWMGHQSIEMTWRRYRNKKRVSFTPVIPKKIPA